MRYIIDQRTEKFKRDYLPFSGGKEPKSRRTVQRRKI
jgi:hypothetical protein